MAFETPAMDNLKAIRRNANKLSRGYTRVAKAIAKLNVPQDVHDQIVSLLDAEYKKQAATVIPNIPGVTDQPAA